MARIAPDGVPRWFRWDYSHHWPTLVDGEHALVPGLRIGEASLSLAGQDSRAAIDLACDDGRMYYDTVRELDGEGILIREVSVFEALTRSPFAAVLQHTTDPCDPIRLHTDLRPRCRRLWLHRPYRWAPQASGQRQLPEATQRAALAGRQIPAFRQPRFGR